MIETTALAALIYYMLRNAAPLMLTAVGGTFTERTGVINIALEGIMTVGAFFAAAVTMLTNNAWLGVLASVVTGLIISYLHGLVCIRFKANQVVSGVAINILAAGLTSFLMKAIFGSGGQLIMGDAPRLPVWSLTKLILGIPGLGRLIQAVIPENWIRFFDESIGSQVPGVYIAFIIVIIAQIILFKTPLGLRIRAVGEHPRAADTLGVNVPQMRYIGVLCSGLLAGFAGSILSISPGASGFMVGMVAGRGFIALAAMIFGKWTPVGAMGACLLFGLSEAVRVSASVILRDLPWMQVIPSQLLALLPYIVTMLALAGFVGRSTPPAASGIPYESEQ
ncbi:MAG TPA: ABC transporter permease [Bacillota bacterium]|nr:ABC transporter permease [Bacillota bacterium]